MTDIRNKHLLIVGIFAFFVYQGINFIYFPLSITFGDEGRFINEAIKMSQIGEFWNFKDRAWEMPLTAILYSAFYTILGNERDLIIIVRLFQSLLLILQAVLLYKISLKIFDDKISAFLTFVIVLFYPFFIYYQALLLSETLFNTILVVSFYYIYKWYENDFILDKTFIFANVFLVLSIYVKGTLSILPPLLLAVFFLMNKYELKGTLKVLLFSIGFYIILMSPWWIRNYSIFNQFVPLTTSSGKVLYLGNNPANKFGGNDMAVDVNVEEFVKIALIEDELEKNRVFKEKAIEFIKNNPDRFLELMILKLKRFYNIIPNAEKFSQGYYKWVSLLSYGAIFILFLASIFIHIKYFKRLSAIYILFLYFTLLHMIFIASLRYRLPLELFMILLSSNILSLLYRRINASKN